MSRIEIKIIKLLALNPTKEFYAQEIVEKIKCSKGSANMILNSLAEKKTIKCRKVGNMKFYQVNSGDPRIKQFKISLALEELAPIIEKIKKISSKIILFGSASRGEQTADSDIDLFIISRQAEEIKKNIKLKKVKPIIKKQIEFSEMKNKDPYFFREIDRGIILWENYEK